MNLRLLSCSRNCFWSLFLGLLAPLFLTQCKTTGGSYKDVEYDPATLKTPGGHGLQKKEYPFDDEGNYRKDWVRNKSGGRTRSSYRNTAPAPAPTEVAQAGSPTSGSTSYPNYQDISSGSGAGPSSSPAPTSSPSSPQYHKVVSGDTLYSLANRYGTSVNELKRTNGLTSDSIRKGQTLRIP